MMIVQFLPMAIVGPLAGVVVDRVNRRRLMIAPTCCAASLILGLLLVRRPDQVWIAYVVMALMRRRAGVLRAGANGDDSRTSRRPTS